MPGGITFVSEVTAIEVHSGILFVPGGQIHQSLNRVRREMEGWARLMVPPHKSQARWGTWATGRLEASIYSNLFTVGNPETLSIEVGARAPYAKYVHEGTASQGRRFIYTTLGWANKNIVDSWIKQGFFEGSENDRGYWMPVHRTMASKPNFYLRVRGQKANPFITEAYTRTAYDHPMLPRQRFRRTFE